MKACTVACILFCLRVTAAGWSRPLVLNDPSYVDSHEGGQLFTRVKSILSQAEQVTGAALMAALPSKPSFVIVPELEIGDWSAALTSSDIAQLQEYVFTTGGRLVVAGANRFWKGYDVNLINRICGTNLEHNDIYCEASGTSTLASAAAQGTPFEYGPRVLDHANAVYCLKGSSMPAGAKVMYEDSVQSVWVFTWQYGEGLVIFLGHDWFSPTAPWLTVLNASLHMESTPSSPFQTNSSLTTPTPSTETQTTATGTMTTTTAIGVGSTMTATTADIVVSTFAAPTTTTTVTTRPVLCTPTKMHCPVPKAWAHAKYEVLGSEGVPACQKKGPGMAPYFEFLIVECNQTREVDLEKGMVNRIATLMPVEVKGAVILVKEPVMPIFVCTCSSQLAGTAANFVLTDEPVPPVIGFEGSYKFDPTLNFFTNASYVAALAQTDQFPLDSERMYVEVYSHTPDDIIGLQHCTASPSGAVADLYEQTLLQSSCAAGPFDLQWHPSADNAVRYSILNFRFGGADRAHITCTVIRCAAQPCGACATDSKRRLSEGEPWFVAEDTKVLSSSVRTPLSGMVLPAFIAPERVRLAWELPPEVEKWAESAPRTNLSIYGCTAAPDKAFVGAVERGLERIFDDSVTPKVLRIFSLLPQLLGERRLAAEEASEVLQAEVALLGLTDALPAHTELVASLSPGGHRTGELLRELRAAFGAADLEGMEDASATFGAIRQGEGPAADVGVVNGPGKRVLMAAIACAAAVFVILLAVCACLLWRRSLRRSQAAVTQPPAKLAQPTAKATSAGNANDDVADAKDIELKDDVEATELHVVL